MSETLGRLTIMRKTGQEPFHSNGQALGFDLLSFWQWTTSDLVSNATRGILGEYIVAHALALAAADVREEWAAFDLQTPSGIKIEVKSAAYVQSWHQVSSPPSCLSCLRRGHGTLQPTHSPARRNGRQTSTSLPFWRIRTRPPLIR